MSHTLISDDSIARGLVGSASFLEGSLEGRSKKTLISDDSIARGLGSFGHDDSYNDKAVCDSLFLSQVYDDSDASDSDEDASCRTLKQMATQVEVNIVQYRAELRRATTMLVANLWARLSIEMKQQHLVQIKKEIAASNPRIPTLAAAPRGRKKGKQYNCLLNVTIPEMSETDSAMGTPLYDVLTPDCVGEKGEGEGHEEDNDCIFQPRLWDKKWAMEAGSIPTAGSNASDGGPHPQIFQDLLTMLPSITVEDLKMIEESQKQMVLEHAETF